MSMYDSYSQGDCLAIVRESITSMTAVFGAQVCYVSIIDLFNNPMMVKSV